MRLGSITFHLDSIEGNGFRRWALRQTSSGQKRRLDTYCSGCLNSYPLVSYLLVGHYGSEADISGPRWASVPNPGFVLCSIAYAGSKKICSCNLLRWACNSLSWSPGVREDNPSRDSKYCSTDAMPWCRIVQPRQMQHWHFDNLTLNIHKSIGNMLNFRQKIKNSPFIIW